MSASPTPALPVDLKHPQPPLAVAVAMDPAAPASPHADVLSRTPTLAAHDQAPFPPDPVDGAGDGRGGLMADDEFVYPSRTRRRIMLALFALAQFMDIYSASGIVIGISQIGESLHMSPGQEVWIVNGYALTLAAFLLTGGRLADIFSAKWTFAIGFAWLGAFSLGIGFVRDQNVFISLRALQGIGAGLTIPAALRMIVIFNPPEDRPMAIAIFGASGAIANILGVVLGGILLLASWDWVFWTIAIVSLPLAVIAVIVTPSTRSAQDRAGRKPKFDSLGTFSMVAAITLITYGTTNGNVEGWDKAQTLAPLLVGVACFFGFFAWEAFTDPFDALIPPHIWRLPNVVLLTAVALLPYWWWFQVETTYAVVMQLRWGNSAVLTGAKFLPIGIAGGAVAAVGGNLPARFPLKWRLVLGCIGAAGGALMYAWAEDSDDYWRLFFPASIIGSAATALVYVSANISLIMSIPSSYAGTAGGIFNSALQLGVVIGLSVATAIQISFPEVEGQAAPSWKGYQSAFFLLMAAFLVCIVGVLVFFKDPVKVQLEEAVAHDVEGGVEEKKRPTVAIV